MFLHPSVRFRPAAIAAAILMLMSLMALAAPPAQAQTTYTVDSSHITGDASNDDEGPDGTCDADCSLREAVIAANANGGSDVIEFEVAGTIQLDRPGVEASDASANDLDIRDGLTIQGHPDGTTLTTGVTLNNDSRILDIIGNFKSPFPVTIDGVTFNASRSDDDGGAVLSFGTDVTIRNSLFINNASVENGGAIRFGSGALVIEDSTFAGNESVDDGGALLLSQHDSITITGTTFDGNSAGTICCGEQVRQGGNGGAIATFFDGTAPVGLIEDTTFTGNTAADNGSSELSQGLGGAIYSQAVPLTINNSVFDNNGGPDRVEPESDQVNDGGGIYYDGQGAVAPLFLTNTSVTNNTAINRGGGIYVADQSRMVIDQSTISGNTATGIRTGEGGGIWASSVQSLVGLANTTVSGNTSVFGGGGVQFGPERLVFLGEQAPTLAVFQFSTIVDNDGDTDQTGAIGGSGISVFNDNMQVRLGSSLLAGNNSLNCAPAARFTSLDHNLEDTDTCNLAQVNDLPDTAPVIGLLADNRGQSQGADGTYVGQTHALLEGSPAIDAADDTVCADEDLDTDERLVVRPQLESCDIGAYEYQEGELDVGVAKSVAPAEIGIGQGAVFTITVTGLSTFDATPVTLTDVVPDSLTIGTITPSAGTCDPPAGQTITCDLGDVGPGDTITITVAVSGTAAGTFTNTAAIDVQLGDGDDNPANDSAEATLVVREDQVLNECTGGLDTNGDTIITDGINRIEGLNRIQTAIAASQAACLDAEAPAVVLTRSDLFPDAQAGTPLAIQLGAPLLLSSPDTLSAETQTEIQRVLAPSGTVYLLGGEVALSAGVNQQLLGLGYTTIRYGGQNRFGTAAIIADLGLNNPPNILVANGGDFADSVVAGAASINVDSTSDTVRAAVLLTSDVNVPPETQSYLDAQSTPPAVIAIGAAAGQAFPSAEEVSGPSRFETAIAVANRFFDDPPVVGIARADDFADGLTGGALVGRPLIGPGPMILTATDTLPSSVENYLTNNASSIESALIFGGSVAVSQTVEDNIASALGFP